MISGPAVAQEFSTIALVGDDANGIAGVTYESLGGAEINNNGTVVYTSILAGSGINFGNDTAVFTSDGLLVREGDTAAGTGGLTFGNLAASNTVFSRTDSVEINDNGVVAFHGGLIGTASESNAGIFTTSDVLVRRGDIVDTGLQVGGIGKDFSLNNNGEVVFETTFQGIPANVTPSTDGAVVHVNQLGTYDIIAREGDRPTGFFPRRDHSFALFDDASIADDGTIAFKAEVLRNVGPGLNQRITAVYSGPPPVAREGDAPTGAGGETLNTISELRTNSQGDIVFTGILSGFDSGLFTPDGVQLLEGDVPDVAPGIRLASFGDFSLADDGGMVFIGNLNFTNGQGLFTRSADGTIQMLLRRGDLFDVGGGDLRTISNFFLARNAIGINGDFVFTAVFDDGSDGIFKFDPGTTQDDPGDDDVAAVPVPAALPLLLVALIGLGLIGGTRRTS